MTMPSKPDDGAADRAAVGADSVPSPGDAGEPEEIGLLERVTRAMRRLWGEPSEDA